MAGVSSGTLSMLEAGAANPTVGTLWALSNVLGCTVADLIGEATDPMVRYVPAGDPAPSGSMPGSRLLHRFAPNGPVELYEARISPGASHISGEHASGVYEHVWVAAGRLLTGPTAEPVRLGPGDYLCFQGWVPHIYEAGPKGATFISALSYTRSLWGTRELLGHGDQQD